MQTLNAAAAIVQAAHSKLQSHPPPALLMQRLGNITPLQGVRMSEGSQSHNPSNPQCQQQQIQNHHQVQARVPCDHGVSNPPNSLSLENDPHSHSSSFVGPASTSDPILIPLMCRVASVIEYLKAHLASSDTQTNSPIAAAVARLENAMARAGVKDIDLRLGDSFQASIHRAVAFTPISDIGQQSSEELDDMFYKLKGQVIVGASARGYKFGSTVVRRACVTVAAESDSSLTIESLDAVDMNDDLADGLIATHTSSGKGSEFLGRLKSYSLSFKSAVAEKLSAPSAATENCVEQCESTSSDVSEHKRAAGLEANVGENHSGSIMSSMMTKALQAAVSVASDYRGASASTSLSTTSGSPQSAESLTSSVFDVATELRGMVAHAASSTITTQYYQSVTKVVRVKLTGLLHEFLSIGFKSRRSHQFRIAILAVLQLIQLPRLMMSQTPWTYVESVCLKKSSDSVLIFQLASYIRAINDFKPFKDSSLHKLRGLVAACLGSGILGEMWRLLMQGEKSNYFNTGAPMVHLAQSDAFLAALQPISALSMNPSLPLHLDASPKDEDTLMETWSEVAVFGDCDNGPASGVRQSGDKALDDVLTSLDA